MNEMAYYAIPADDDHPFERVGHFLKKHAPDGCREIDLDEAIRINEAVTARTAKSTPTAIASAAAGVDLKPIQDQIDALAQAVIGHAKTLDAHQEKLQSTQTSVATYLQGVKEGKPG